ncbi:MAG: glycoside hydrolase family 95 protein [Ruminococcaceae bacterium]|nr:glycoside hydrolase family 95 protein [Oscillospiraceae bacterium]
MEINMKHTLWYNTWTELYREGLPIGNGRLAAMMLGRPEKLRIALNHEWMWRGENRFREYPDVSEHLPEIREALLQGDFEKGTALANEYMGGLGGVSGIRNRVDPYQPVGDLWVEVEAGDATEYKRSLDLDTGLAVSEFTAPSGRITQRLFTSSADGCIVAEITSDSPADMTAILSRTDDPRCTVTYRYAEDGLTLCGSFTDGISFEAALRADTDGELTVTENRLQVRRARRLTILVQIGTDAKGNPPSEEIIWPTEFDFETLFARHKVRFAALRGEAVLDVAVEDGSDLPTDQRILRFREGLEPSMPLLYFEYGRYLMVSGSSGELPLNLQGKWNEELAPAWEADYHLDINLEMCYWFAETLGLNHAAGTLFNLIEKYVPYGRVMARNLYGCRGFNFTIQTDVWGRVTPEAKGWAVWLGAAPWLGQHLFQHWRYTKDIDFLKNRCYPYLKECAAFYEDYLVERDGELWILPSQSPENRFEGTGSWPVSIGINCAMDIELTAELLQSAIECAEILGEDSALIAKWQDMLNRLPALTIDSIGRLNEWDTERVEVEPGHRHLSHIYGLYPSQLFEPGSREWVAAERSLDERLSHGGGHTGWSRSWVACLMARLGRGEEAWEHFIHLIGDFATISLLDLHPPVIFQIDGNMGGTACVCEMLMQSRRGELKLLPALPKAWPCGRVENFHAQDGVKASFAWTDGRLTECVLEASEALELKVTSDTREWNLHLEPGVTRVDVGD